MTRTTHDFPSVHEVTKMKNAGLGYKQNPDKKRPCCPDEKAIRNGESPKVRKVVVADDFRISETQIYEENTQVQKNTYSVFLPEP